MRRGGPAIDGNLALTLRARLVASALALIALVVLLGAAAPSSPAFVPYADFVPSPEGPAGGSVPGGGLGLVLLGALALALIVAAIAVAVILYRTRGPRVARAPDEGWWTCQSCGAGNIDGAARCHACATWRTSVPRPTTTA